MQLKERAQNYNLCWTGFRTHESTLIVVQRSNQLSYRANWELVICEFVLNAKTRDEWYGYDYFIYNLHWFINFNFRVSQSLLRDAAPNSSFFSNCTPCLFLLLANAVFRCETSCEEGVLHAVALRWKPKKLPRVAAALCDTAYRLQEAIQSAIHS